MYRFVQFDAVTGKQLGSTDRWADYNEDGTIKSPAGKVVIDSQVRPEAATAIAYDLQADTFTPAPPRAKLLSKADVIGALSPATWAELNKFNPRAEGSHAGGTPYNDAEVFWAMSVFNSAAKDFALNDARIGSLLSRFVAKNIMTAQERDTLVSTLATVAR